VPIPKPESTPSGGTEGAGFVERLRAVLDDIARFRADLEEYRKDLLRRNESPDFMYVASGNKHRPRLCAHVLEVLRLLRLLKAHFPTNPTVSNAAEGIRALEIAQLDDRGQPPQRLTVNEVLRDYQDLEAYLRLVLNVVSVASATTHRASSASGAAGTDTSTRAATAPPGPLRGAGPRRKYGPAPNLNRHGRINDAVRPYGDAWKAEQNRQEIAEELDKQKVPPPSAWTQLQQPARSWSRGLEHHPERWVKVIQYSLEYIRKGQPQA